MVRKSARRYRSADEAPEKGRVSPSFTQRHQMLSSFRGLISNMIWMLFVLSVLTTVPLRAVVDFGADAAPVSVTGAKASGNEEASYSFPSVSNEELRVVEDIPSTTTQTSLNEGAYENDFLNPCFPYDYSEFNESYSVVSRVDYDNNYVDGSTNVDIHSGKDVPIVEIYPVSYTNAEGRLQTSLKRYGINTIAIKKIFSEIFTFSNILIGFFGLVFCSIIVTIWYLLRDLARCNRGSDMENSETAILARNEQEVAIEDNTTRSIASVAVIHGKEGEIL